VQGGREKKQTSPNGPRIRWETNPKKKTQRSWRVHWKSGKKKKPSRLARETQTATVYHLDWAEAGGGGSSLTMAQQKIFVWERQKGEQSKGRNTNQNSCKKTFREQNQRKTKSGEIDSNGKQKRDNERTGLPTERRGQTSIKEKRVEQGGVGSQKRGIEETNQRNSYQQVNERGGTNEKEVIKQKKKLWTTTGWKKKINRQPKK